MLGRRYKQHAVLSVVSFWETADVITFPEVQEKVRAAYLKGRDSQSVGWVSSGELSLFSCCFILCVRARWGFGCLMEEDYTITRGIQLFLFCFFCPSSNLGCPTPFQKLCMWSFAFVSSEVKIWKVYCRIIFSTNWAGLWKPSGKATFWEKPFSQVTDCNHRVSCLSHAEKLPDPKKVAGDLWYLYTRNH